MIIATYFLPQPDMRWLYALLAVAAVVVVFPVMMAVMPVAGACCAYAAPVVGQLAMGAVIIAAFAFVTKPKGK